MLDITLGEAWSATADFLRSVALWQGGLGGFVGGLAVAVIGHRLTLSREKRRDYNELALALREPLLGDVTTHNGGRLRLPREDDLRRLDPLCWWWQRRRIRRAVRAVERELKAQGSRDERGQFKVKDPAPVNRELVRLRQALRPR